MAKKISKKGHFGGPQKSLKKYPEKSKNTDFRTFLGIFRFFRVFSGTFVQTRKKTFLRFFCDFGPGGSGDSCKWRLGSQPEMPIKLGKTSQYHNWPRYMDWAQIGPKIAIKQGKKTPNGQMVPISRAHLYTGIVNYYAVVFLLRLPNLLCCDPFFEGRDAYRTKESNIRARGSR